MVTWQKNFPQENNHGGFMGGAHSSSKEKTCSDTCFGSIPALPELMAPKFTNLASQLRSCDGFMGGAVVETPKRKLSGQSGYRETDDPFHSTLSADSKQVQRELSRINQETSATEVASEDEFILLAPRHLRDTTSCVILKGNQQPHASEPSFRPTSQIGESCSRSSERAGGQGDTISTESCNERPMLDFDRRLKDHSPERRNRFVPIPDYEEEDELLDESSPQRSSPGHDSVGRGQIPSFKLKPRKSRRMRDYKFSW